MIRKIQFKRSLVRPSTREGRKSKRPEAAFRSQAVNAFIDYDEEQDGTGPPTGAFEATIVIKQANVCKACNGAHKHTCGKKKGARAGGSGGGSGNIAKE